MSSHRWQFTLTVMFHHLSPILTMGPSLHMLWFVIVATFGREARWLRPLRKTPAPRAAHDRAAHFWAKIFAVTFGVGVNVLEPAGTDFSGEAPALVRSVPSADVVDEELVVDEQFTTSRSPRDLPAFCPGIVEQFARRHAAVG